MTTLELARHYEDRYIQWLKARKENQIAIGPEPDPRDFQLLPWAAEAIKKRVNREMNRP